jgi:monofunctional biosynthetic peptidoglycan transglycosylase
MADTKRTTRRTRRTRRGGGSAFRRWAIRVALVLVALLVALPAVTIFALRWLPPPTSSIMVQDALAARRAGNAGYRIDYRWRPWGAISLNAAAAVIAAEDQRFPEHFGFDFEAIEDAFEEREQRGRLRGASTISQQVAKNLFLWPGRSYARKGAEAYLTVLIELLWPKRRILEVYLNIAEMGRGIYGVEAASRRYFSKSAKKLTPREAALLAAALPSPRRYRVAPPSPYVQERADWILQQMEQLGGTAYLKEW